MESGTTEQRRSAWQSVRRELARTVTRTPHKVFAKLTGRPWPPEPFLRILEDGIARKVPCYPNGLSPDEIRSLVGKSDPVILEIGANDGEDSRKFLDYFGRMKLFCFEPDPRAIAKFKRHVDDDRCTLVEKAVAASSGTTTFWQSGGDFSEEHPDWDRSGSIHRPTGHLQLAPEVVFNNVIEVPTVTLDDWAAEQPGLGTINFLWMDVQGAEHDVFAGAAKTLPKVRYLYSEFYQRPMYEGQMNLDSLLGMLPGFSLLGIYESYNFLAINRNLEQR